MCAPIIGAISAISGIAGSMGQHQSASAQAAAQNKAAIRNYKHQIAERELNWRNTLNSWNQKRMQYKVKINENHLAANRAYAGEQQKLNEIYQKAAFSNEEVLTKMVGQQGQNLAAGRTGKSAQRSNSMMMAAVGRQQAQLAASLTSARQQTMTTNRDVRNKLISTNNDAFSEVAMKPLPGIAPPAPVMTPGPSGLSLLAGIAGGVAQGIGAFQGLKAPDAGSFGNYQAQPMGTQQFQPSAFSMPTSSFGSFGKNLGTNSFDLNISPFSL